MGPLENIPKKLCKAAEHLIYIRIIQDGSWPFTADAGSWRCARSVVNPLGRGFAMAKTVAKIMGVLLLLVGILGFTNVLDPLGAHIGPNHSAHNLVHLVSGILALYFGFAGTLGGAKTFCTVFGLVYLLLGIVGLAMGDLNIGPLILGKVDTGYILSWARSSWLEDLLLGIPSEY